MKCRYVFAALLCLSAGCEAPKEPITDATKVLDRQNSSFEVGRHSIYLSDCNNFHAILDVIMYPLSNGSYAFQVAIDSHETRTIVNPGTSEILFTATYSEQCKLLINK